jgi:hypothetical protein
MSKSGLGGSLKKEEPHNPDFDLVLWPKFEFGNQQSDGS